MAYSAKQISTALGGIDYGTAAGITATPGAYTELYAKDIEADTDSAMVEVEVQKSDPARGPEPSIVGPDRGTVKFKIPMRGGKLVGGSGGTSIIATLGQYCGMALHDLAGGTAKITGGTTTTMTCLDADDPGWSVGDMILLDCDGTLVMRQILRIQSSAGTTTITVSPEMPGSPQSGADFYPTDTLVPDPDRVSTFVGLDVYRGEGSTDRNKIRALGCAGKFALEEVEAGGLPWVAFEYMIGGGWTSSDESRANADDAYAEPPLFLSDAFYFDDTQIHVKSFAFDPGSNPQMIEGQTATGIQGFKYLEPAVALSVNPLFDDQYFTDWLAGTIRKAFVSRVVDQYQAWSIGVPAVQVTKAGDRNEFTTGIASAGISLKVVDPGENADSTQYPLFAIGFAGI